MLKPVRFVFCVIIMEICSILYFSSFVTISYHFPWYFRMLPLVFLRFPRVFLLFPLSVSPVFYFRFCEFLVTCFNIIFKKVTIITIVLNTTYTFNKEKLTNAEMFTKTGTLVSAWKHTLTSFGNMYGCKPNIFRVFPI